MHEFSRMHEIFSRSLMQIDRFFLIHNEDFFIMVFVVMNFFLVINQPEEQKWVNAEKKFWDQLLDLDLIDVDIRTDRLFHHRDASTDLSICLIGSTSQSNESFTSNGL